MSHTATDNPLLYRQRRSGSGGARLTALVALRLAATCQIDRARWIARRQYAHYQGSSEL